MKSYTTGTRVLSKRNTEWPFKGPPAISTQSSSPINKKRKRISHYRKSRQIPSEPLSLHRKVNLQSGSRGELNCWAVRATTWKSFDAGWWWWGLGVSPYLQSAVRLRSNTSIREYDHRLIWPEWLHHVALQHRGLLGNNLFTLFDSLFLSVSFVLLEPGNLDTVGLKDHTSFFKMPAV